MRAITCKFIWHLSFTQKTSPRELRRSFLRLMSSIEIRWCNSVCSRAWKRSGFWDVGFLNTKKGIARVLSINESPIRSLVKNFGHNESPEVFIPKSGPRGEKSLLLEEKLLGNARVTSLRPCRFIYPETDKPLRCVFLFFYFPSFPPQVRFSNEKMFQKLKDGSG